MQTSFLGMERHAVQRWSLAKTSTSTRAAPARCSSSGPVKNVDLWKRLLKAKEPHQVEFIWVKGHDGHPQNERCDRLATTAADGDDLIEDTGLNT